MVGEGEDLLEIEDDLWETIALLEGIVEEEFDGNNVMGACSKKDVPKRINFTQIQFRTFSYYYLLRTTRLPANPHNTNKQPATLP